MDLHSGHLLDAQTPVFLGHGAVRPGFEFDDGGVGFHWRGMLLSNFTLLSKIAGGGGAAQ
jgi:hypothetical protein